MIVNEGPEAFAKAVRKNKGSLIMDITWRNAQQSLLVTKVQMVDFCKIAKETSHGLGNAWALER